MRANLAVIEGAYPGPGRETLMPGFPADPTGELHEPEAGFKVLLWVCKFVLFFIGF